MSRAYPTDCVLWPFMTDKKGYGVLMNGREYVKAHRAVYQLFVGPIAEGLHVLHSCDNRGCVNPAHLRLGTHAENMRQMKERGRHSHGTKMPTAKLTDDVVRRLRSGAITVKQAVSETGACFGTLYQAKRGETWKHI